MGESLDGVVHTLINNLEKLYYEPSPHPMLEKCYICESSDTNLLKWAPQLGWENLIDHYQGKLFILIVLQSMAKYGSPMSNKT